MDLLGEVLWVGDGLQQVVLHQAHVIELGRAGRAHLLAAWFHKHLRNQIINNNIHLVSFHYLVIHVTRELHASSVYHGVNDGVLVVLPDVVVEEDVLDGRVKGVHPQGLPPQQGVGVPGPPGNRGGGGEERERREERYREKPGERKIGKQGEREMDETGEERTKEERRDREKSRGEEGSWMAEERRR